ncbi:GUF1-like protein [Scenedesmus sp. PABB004]|nr:GUF1-like protein [Scenedesmus sp. PABB004]
MLRGRAPGVAGAGSSHVRGGLRVPLGPRCGRAGPARLAPGGSSSRPAHAPPRPGQRASVAAAAAAVAPETLLEKGGPGAKYGNGAVAKVPVERIRNFCIIAHIDHGKSTLADQLLLKTETVAARDMMDQFMDSNDIERERGITIKLNTARMRYTAADGQLYALNLIDTPGHVDFTYEVSRSLAACEGALLVVDASQGVEAQTLANVWLALENDLEIVPILNKIDLPGAEPERVIREIEEIIGLDCSNIIRASAKTGVGIAETLEAIVARVPPPQNTCDAALRALIFDSYYDPYRGVVCQFRVMDGVVKRGDTVVMMNTGKEYTLDEIGVLAPVKTPVDALYAGEVGYLAAQIKSVQDARVGDTVTIAKAPAAEALGGYEDVQPMVYCGLFPTDADDYQDLREALGKLQLNDAALKFEPEVNNAMGFGFRCGFLGLLHMEIVQERLEREYDLDLVTTAPTVVYRALLTDGTEVTVNSPGDLPEPTKRQSLSEPYVRLEMVTPTDYVGNLMELANNRRGEFVEMKYLTDSRTTLVFNIPLAEVVTDYFDQLKSRSKGYASMEYKITGYRANDLVLLEIKINGEPADPLSVICHRDASYRTGKALCSKLKELIPRQMFRVPIQACIGTKVIASEAIAPYRKDVLAKCYGGDISRKKKLLAKQAEGKKRMKQLGRVEVPQAAFMAVLKINTEEK